MFILDMMLLFIRNVAFGFDDPIRHYIGGTFIVLQSDVYAVIGISSWKLNLSKKKK